MKLPKISIVIPSYNKSKYFEQTLESIFVQKYQNLELIIQDGGSTDGTIEIIKKYANKYPVIWESKKDNGQLDAINKGLSKATGDILTFINADDCYTDICFEEIASSYSKNPDALWFAGRGIVIDENGNEIVEFVKIYKDLLLKISLYNILLTTNYLIQPSVFITKKAYKKYGAFTGTRNFVMEYDYWLKLGKESMPVIINGNLSKFRLEDSTKTKQMSGKLLEEDWKIVRKYSDNPLILILHKLNNIGRIIVGKLV